MDRKKLNVNKQKKQGFTIVELLIVIVVIAVLAAITIVSYNGIATRAHEAALMSELSQASSKLAIYKVTTGSAVYPQTVEDAGLRVNESTSFFYTPNANATGYCLSGTNASRRYYYTTAENGSVREGRCLLTVSTFAGSGVAGNVNGIGTAAQLNEPTAAVFAPNGDLYIADYSNHAIRKATPSGSVTLFAGSSTGQSGNVNAQGASARFYAPGGIAVDNAGVLYVADQFNSAIRKIALDGTVSLLAGGSAGSANGTGAAAQFYYPWAVAVDAAGTVYVADTYNNMIRKITPGGQVTTFAGSTVAGYVDGNGSTARFNYPSGIAVGPGGVVYVADQDNNRVRKITPSGDVTTLAGSGTRGTVDGIGDSAQFASPHGIAADVHGNVYVADEYSHSIRKIAPDGSVYTIAGSTAQGFQDGLSDVARFSQPIGLATSSDGRLFVIERGNNRVRIIRYQT